MTLRVNTQDLVDEVNRMRAVFPDYQWPKTMIEPHPGFQIASLKYRHLLA